MICNKCGSENRHGAKFCDECGSLLAAAVPEIATSAKDPEVTAVLDDLKADTPLEVPEPSSSADDTHVIDGFDFNPIETEALPAQDPVAPEFDTRGVDEIIAGPDYRGAESAWGSGDTMKMPRVDGQAPEQKREFKAPDAKKQGSGKRNRIVIAVLIVVALLVGGGTTVVFVDLPDGTNLADAMGVSALLGGKKIPDVTDLDKNAATSALEARGFKVKTMGVKSDEPEDTVLMTDPLAGSRLAEGETVILQVAESRTIPEVVGKSQDDAQKLFVSEGLTHVKVVTEKSNEPEGTVLKVVPEPGSKAVSTTDVTLTVAEPYKVPDVMGSDYASALAVLEAEGYQVYVVYSYSESAEGTVLSSDPAAGSTYNTGEVVTLTLAKSRGSELVELTNSRFSSGFEIEGTYYSVVSIDSAEYIGNDMVSCLITCSISSTTSTGEVLTGETKQRAFIVSFDGNNNSSISAS